MNYEQKLIRDESRYINNMYMPVRGRSAIAKNIDQNNSSIIKILKPSE
jgi:hypothetical protein